MVRRCIVKNCKSTDLSTLSHRFPRNINLAIRWLNSLGVQEFENEKNIYNKFVVCTLHFVQSDYRNPLSNYLNANAIPTLTDNNMRLETLSPSPPSQEIRDSTDDEQWFIMLEQINDNEGSTISNPNHEIEDNKIGPENKNDSEDELIESDPFETLSDHDDSISDIEVLDDDENITDNIDIDESNKELIEYSDYGGVEVDDAACQVDSDELEDSASKDDIYRNLTRDDLIKELIISRSQISCLKTKLENMQCAHSKLLQSMDALKCLIGP